MVSRDLSSLSLFPATHEQVLEGRKRTFVQWARGSSMDEFMKKDAVMDEMEHAKNGRTIDWVLAPRDDPTTLDFMCSCTTFHRPGLVANGHPPQVEDVTGYGIASVFTPPSKRGNGYARHMMRLLHWVLAPRSSLPAVFPPAWGTPPQAIANAGNARFSVLYSDIGSTFYRECGPSEKQGTGWIVTGATQTIWDVHSEQTASVLRESADMQWEWLTEEDARAVWEKDSQLMRTDAMAEAASSGKLCFAFRPDNGLGIFSIQATMRFTPELVPILPSDIWGVRLQVDETQAPKVSSDNITFATWILELRPGSPRTLIVTRLRVPKAAFAALVSKLLEAARQHKVDKLEMWGLPKELEELAEQLGGTTKFRDEHMSAVKWYGPETGDQIQWLFNERFSWC